MIGDYMWGKNRAGSLRVCALRTALTSSDVYALVGRASNYGLDSVAEATVTVSEFGIKQMRGSESALTSWGSVHTVPQDLVLNVVRSGKIVGVAFLLIQAGVISHVVYLSDQEVSVNRWDVGIDDRDGVIVSTL